MRLCLPPDDCMLTHFHIFQGNGSPECTREGGSVNKSRAIALRVSTNSVWFLQHCQQIQFIMRESIRGKAGKEKQKTAPKKYPMILCNVSKDKSPSIQYYFAKYPCFVFLPSLPHPARKTSGANRPKQFRDAKGRNHPGQQMRSPTPSCQTWIYAKQARCKKQKRLPRERDSLLLISLL